MQKDCSNQGTVKTSAFYLSKAGDSAQLGVDMLRVVMGVQNEYEYLIL